MLNSFLTNENQVLFLALILLRIIAFIFSSAIFSSPNISIPIKVLFSFLLSFMLFSLHRPEAQNLTISENIISLSVQEILVGVMIGLVTRFFFFAISMAGDLISISIGLNSAQVFNPISGSNSNTMEQFQILLATLVFFSLQGHHLLITALSESFTIFPVASASFSWKSFPEVAKMGGELMEIALKMASPVVVSIFLVNITMGILGRTVPQLNVLVTSLSVTMSVGLLVMIVTLPLMVFEMNSIINLTGKYVFQLMRNF